MTIYSWVRHATICRRISPSVKNSSMVKDVYSFGSIDTFNFTPELHIEHIYLISMSKRSKSAILSMFHVEQFCFRLPFHVKLKTAKTLLNSGVFEGFRPPKNNFATFLRVKNYRKNHALSPKFFRAHCFAIFLAFFNCFTQFVEYWILLVFWRIILCCFLAFRCVKMSIFYHNVSKKCKFALLFFNCLYCYDNIVVQYSFFAA